jgi:hypothetical protein
MHAPLQFFQNTLAYFSKAIGYSPKMFKKLTPGGNPTSQVLHSRVDSWLYPETLEEAGKACQGRTL